MKELNYLEGWKTVKDSNGFIVHFNPKIVYRYEFKCKKLSA